MLNFVLVILIIFFMKFPIFVFAILLSYNFFAQNNEVENESNEPEFTCDFLNFNKNKLTFTGNVSFKTDIIQVEDADKIVYNQNKKKMVITGLDRFVMDGEVHVKNKAKKKRLRYTVGERIAYVD